MKEGRVVAAILGILIVLLLAAASIMMRAKFNSDIIHTLLEMAIGKA